MDGSDYSRRFAKMADELDEWYGMDCAGLWAVALDCMSAELRDLLAARLESVHSQLGGDKFTNLARLLLLQTGDELWKDYRAGLRFLTVSSRLGNYGHKSAVADYIIHASDDWRRFQGEHADWVLSRLLTFPLDRLLVNNPQPEKAVELDKSVAMLVS